MKKIIIAVNLGHFKAYRVSKKPYENTKTELIKSYDSIEAHGKLSDKLSDNAGRFAMGGGKNGAAKGYGEPHNISLETEKKLIKMITRDINDLVKKERCLKWHLAAGSTINKKIIQSLTPDVKASLSRNVTADLTKTPRSEILRYFE